MNRTDRSPQRKPGVCPESLLFLCPSVTPNEYNRLAARRFPPHARLCTKTDMWEASPTPISRCITTGGGMQGVIAVRDRSYKRFSCKAPHAYRSAETECCRHKPTMWLTLLFIVIAALFLAMTSATLFHLRWVQRLPSLSDLG